MLKLFIFTPPLVAAEATGLGFFCFVVVNPCVLSANRIDLGFFVHKFSNLLPPPPQVSLEEALGQDITEDSGSVFWNEMLSSLHEYGGGGWHQTSCGYTVKLT